jgi:hypothetical protein
MAAESKSNHESKIMKRINPLLFLALLVAIGSALAIGCRTTANPSGVVTVGPVTLDPVKTGKAVQFTAKWGSVAVIRKNPELRQYFEDASIAVGLAVNSGNVTPDDIALALAPLTKNPDAAGMVNDVLSQYRDYYGDLLAQKLAGKSPYTVPVLTGLANGLNQAYDLTAP